MSNYEYATQHEIIQKDSFKDELIKIVGKNQVPCLIVDGYPMLESDDIIKYLDTNRDKWNKKKKKSTNKKNFFIKHLFKIERLFYNKKKLFSI